MWDWFSHRLSAHRADDNWNIVGITEEQENRVRDNISLLDSLQEDAKVISVIAERIAGGHASRLHVLGREYLQIDGRIRKGRSEFDSDNRHGYALGIKTQEDFARHIRETLVDPETIGYRRADGIFSLFNQKTNTVVIVHADNPDFGTSYRPRDGIKDFIKRNVEADRKSGLLGEPLELTLHKGGIPAILNKNMGEAEEVPSGQTAEQRLIDLGMQVHKQDGTLFNKPLYKQIPAETTLCARFEKSQFLDASHTSPEFERESETLSQSFNKVAPPYQLNAGPKRMRPDIRPAFQ